MWQKYLYPLLDINITTLPICRILYINLPFLIKGFQGCGCIRSDFPFRQINFGTWKGMVRFCLGEKQIVTPNFRHPISIFLGGWLPPKHPKTTTPKKTTKRTKTKWETKQRFEACRTWANFEVLGLRSV